MKEYNTKHRKHAGIKTGVYQPCSRESSWISVIDRLRLIADFLNNELGITKDFYWQDGYGAETFAERDLDKIIRYVENQEVHHRTGNLDNRLEYIPDPDAPDDNDDDT